MTQKYSNCQTLQTSTFDLICKLSSSRSKIYPNCRRGYNKRLDYACVGNLRF